MVLKGIISNPNAKEHRSFQIVYLWEQIISINYPLPIIPIKSYWNFLLRNINKIGIFRSLFLCINKYFPVSGVYLFFNMVAGEKGLKIERLKNVLPVIIDFWIPDERLKNFYDYYSASKCLLITSREVYEHLKQQKCPIPLAHFPLSIPNENVVEKNIYHAKEIDFLFPGRKDPVFWEYIKEYEKKHPDIEYVYQELDGTIPYYISNKRGRLKDDFFSREGYIQLLRKSRITFYATPGMDKSKEANGFNQVTPRFLELLASGCLVMGRYIENPDTDFYNLKKYCPLVKSYEDFLQVLDSFCNPKWAEQHISTYYTYLQGHTTSSRIPILKEIMQKI
ncbi:MAG: glycosyltransferase [Candidatus Azobacteroides sp.]|nr:glycosyltransferase [Candidatus Azobacteroides sp.]